MKLSHVDDCGKINMVDVGNKEKTERTASARCKVLMKPETLKAIIENNIKKGDVLTTAKLAGIQAAKKTYELIPLCHNIFISKVDISIEIDEANNQLVLTSFAKTNDKTGIEMEALTSVSVAALTVYDMCKAIDKSIVISEIELISKTGGKSGDYFKEAEK